MNIVELKKAIKNLSYFDRKELLSALEHSSQQPSALSNDLEEARFSKGIYCPHCGCTENIAKYGKTAKGAQRYLCRNCGKTFSSTSDSVLQGTHKSLVVWEQYIECMLDGLSLKKTSEKCGICQRTAFNWRHKILDAISMKKERETKLSGVIEADETFFRISYKGIRKLSSITIRKAHRRGMRATKRGLSRYQVCVPCAIDRTDSVLSKVCNLGKISSRNLDNFYRGKVEEGAIFCTDSEKSYIKFTERHEYKHIQIASGKHKSGIYHINHVNAYHNNMKTFLRGFRGVSTKYLNNYLALAQCIKMGIGEFFRIVASEIYNVRCAEISARASVPVMVEIEKEEI